MKTYLGQNGTTEYAEKAERSNPPYREKPPRNPELEAYLNEMEAWQAAYNHERSLELNKYTEEFCKNILPEEIEKAIKHSLYMESYRYKIEMFFKRIMYKIRRTFKHIRKNP